MLNYLYGDNAWELYDLKKDSHELHNVFGKPTYKEVATRLQAQLAVLRKELGAEPIFSSGRQGDR